MEKFKEYNERLNPDGSDPGLSGVNEKGILEFKDAIWDLRFDKSEFRDHMEQSFYSSQDWPKDAKQVGKQLEQINKLVMKVFNIVDKWA